ncbi:hypothetical protein Godav_020794, partial [Gossypium davidsonii]|nr:hypothetical protein [Gossypium davidsonii]MBA0643624.1 hypothetical protein [Gossypium klotzschianum]
NSCLCKIAWNWGFRVSRKGKSSCGNSFGFQFSCGTIVFVSLVLFPSHSSCFYLVTHSVGLERDSPTLRGAFMDAIMVEDINELLMKLSFSEEKTTRVMSTKVKISNIPMEYIDRLITLEVGNAIGEVIAIDWRNRNGGWVEYMRLRVIIDVLKLLHRVVQFVNSEGAKFVCAIRYKCLPRFCYIYGLISHSIQRCDKKKESSKSNKMRFQYENWLTAHTGMPNQKCGPWRNGIEVITDNKVKKSESNGKTQRTIEVNELTE